MIVAYVRVSTNKQDVKTQLFEIKQYCQINQVKIDKIIVVEISSMKSEADRKINELKKMKKGDILITTELSRLGRSMMHTINLIMEFNDRGIKIIFIRQPELSTFKNSFSKLLLAFYAFIAETEREFISERTKVGIKHARAKGKIIGRPKNTFKSCYDDKINIIKEKLQQKIPLKRIWKDMPNSCKKSYQSLYYFCKSRHLL